MSLPRTWPGAGLAVLVPAASADHPDDEAIRQQLQRVLSRPEFGGGGDPSWLQRALLEFFRWLGSLSTTAPLLFWMLLVACVLLLVLVVALVTWKVRRMLVFAPGEGARGRAAAERARLSQAYRDQARERAAGGDFTEAVRFLFLSLVYRFDEDGRVLFQRAYTNREYLGLFEDRAQVNQDLGAFVDVLDDNWYGQRPTDRTHYEECLARYDRLLQRA